MHEIDTLSDL